MSAVRPVAVEVWTDVQCVWCYIASPRFQEAVDAFSGKVDIRYRSFLLNPTAPRTTDAAAQRRHHQAVNPQFAQIMSQLKSLTSDEHLDYEPDRIQPTNSRSAMELLHHAGQSGRRGALTQRLFRAHFVDGQNISDLDVLTASAADVGIPSDEARVVLQDHRHRAAVNADMEAAQQLGATGAPFYAIDGKWGLAGAQAVDTYLAAFTRAASS